MNWLDCWKLGFNLEDLGLRMMGVLFLEPGGQFAARSLTR